MTPPDVDTEMKWQGADSLREYLVPVNTLERYPGNPRRGQVRLIAESLSRFGQVRPVLVEGHQIVAGNHTFAAAVELGWTHVAAVRNTFRDEREARAYLLGDNRLGELGDYEREQLLPMLEEVGAADRWTGTGYTADDLDDLRALHGPPPTMPVAPFEGDYAATAEELAARAERLAAGNAYKELVLTLTADQNVEFESHLKVLRKETGETGTAEIVANALAAEAALA